MLAKRITTKINVVQEKKRRGIAVVFDERR